MPLKRRRWYAVRIGDYVEIRSTVKGLKAIKSSHSYPSKGGTITLTQTYYDGGRVEAVWDFYAFLGKSYPFVRDIPNDGIVELNNKAFINRMVEGGTRWRD